MTCIRLGPLGGVLAAALTFSLTSTCSADDFFRSQVAPILERHCVSCHIGDDAKGKLSLETAATVKAGGDSGPPIVPGNIDDSYLLEVVSGEKPLMPKNSPPLSKAQVEILRRWIKEGAVWPEGVELQDRKFEGQTWWSLEKLARPSVPTFAEQAPQAKWVRNAVDAFVAREHLKQGLEPAPEASRRTLIRRLYFDLTGLPPTPADIDAFLNDQDPRAYERLVDRLLDSPNYGERWARHWLDIVHYGDTHGYDKDKPRPNAWPYRDYVIRALNSDKPYSRFVQEQVAGDVLYPGTLDGIEALGFIAAGPWDFIGHAEVPESKTDGKIARHLDRDDMIGNTIGTFNSLTVQCAQCHNHKFDPIPQEDYYRLQAVFSALDRADKMYDADPAVSKQRIELLARQRTLNDKKKELEAKVAQLGGTELAQLDQQIAAANQPENSPLAAQFGYHSNIEQTPDKPKWVQVDLGQPAAIDAVEVVACHDTFNNIGAGFGFPVSFKIELSDDPAFQTGVTIITDQSRRDVPNPGVKPQQFPVGGKSGRYVRFTATKLAPRQNDYILALAELSVLDAGKRNLAVNAKVTSLDSIEAAPRWRAINLVDGYYYGIGKGTNGSLAELQRQRDELLAAKVDADTRKAQTENQQELATVAAALGRLPAGKVVYAGTVHTGSGAFTGTGATGGQPRPIYMLHRGDVKQPRQEVSPGALRAIKTLPADFDLPLGHAEGDRRAMLAKWLTSTENPLTWRSIVNRVWQYHFGRGIVETPNDFGRMGALPTHPELLDWLAVEFRDGGQSLKQLHRIIVTSATYRQASTAPRAADFAAADADNRFLWRMNRRKLEAEAIHDAALAVSGHLNPQMYGPGFQDFVIEKPEHSPHYEYNLFNPEDPGSHRRSIYRFIVRSQQQPFMTTLDCADPSQRVDKRNESLSSLQALTLLNNGFMVTMEQYFAKSIEAEGGELSTQVEKAFLKALGRPATPAELQALTGYAKTHGLSNCCRLLLNLNEFAFVD